jgi:hypothetical protein
MPGFKFIATVVVISAATYLGIEHYKQRKAS